MLNQFYAAPILSPVLKSHLLNQFWCYNSVAPKFGCVKPVLQLTSRPFSIGNRSTEICSNFQVAPQIWVLQMPKVLVRPDAKCDQCGPPCQLHTTPFNTIVVLLVTLKRKTLVPMSSATKLRRKRKSRPVWWT